MSNAEWTVNEEASFFAECGDCGGRRYADVDPAFYVCEGTYCHEMEQAHLHPMDIDVERNETATVRNDDTGRPALFVLAFDEHDTSDEEDI